MGNESYDAGRTLTTVGTYAAAGAMVGTAVPVIGTAVGAVGGAVVGGLVSMFSGGPEAQHHEANIGGKSIDARQIWEQIHDGDTTSLDAGSRAASSLKDVHDERSRLIQQINDLMDGAWKGMASGQVQAGAHPLGIWLQDSATNLGKSNTYLSDQSTAFHTIKSKVQEIPAKPPEGDFIDGINPMSDVDDQIEKYNQQGQSNVEAFNNYYQASMTNAGGMPLYSAWQGNSFSDGGTPPGMPGGVGGAGNMPGATGGAGNFQPAGTGKLPEFSSTTPTPSTNLPNSPNTGFPPGSNPGGYNPSFGDATTAAGYQPTSTSGFGPGGGSGAGQFGAGGGAGAGAGGGGVGAAGFGAFGPGGGVGAGATSGTGAGVGPGAGGAGAGRGAGGRGAAGRGGMGAPGMGGRGGHANGEDDEEHENKYMVGDDPNELFGTDELTAPPVIGE